MSDTILVEACEGKHVPLHPTDHSQASDGPFYLKHGDPPIEVKNTTGIRRRIVAGDLRRVEPPKAEAAPVAHPAKPAHKSDR